MLILTPWLGFPQDSLQPSRSNPIKQLIFPFFRKVSIGHFPFPAHHFDFDSTSGNRACRSYQWDVQSYSPCKGQPEFMSVYLPLGDTFCRHVAKPFQVTV